MNTINAYFTFNGNCKDAMIFYQKCLGGKLSFQTIGESPMCEKMPSRIKNCILHAELINKGFTLMGSDMVGERGLLKGNAVSLLLNCVSEIEIRLFYKKLSIGGEQTLPLRNTFWNALSGGLTDKFGNSWLLYYFG